MGRRAASITLLIDDVKRADGARFFGEVAAWQTRRNKHNTKASWQFTNDDARSKLKHLYPSL
jgi:hypothetical protein